MAAPRMRVGQTEAPVPRVVFGVEGLVDAHQSRRGGGDHGGEAESWRVQRVKGKDPEAEAAGRLADVDHVAELCG